MVESERIQNPWMASEESAVPSVEINEQDSLILESPGTGMDTRVCVSSPTPPPQPSGHEKLGIVERSFSAAGAAFLSAIIVNPLDVAKVKHSVPGFFCYE